VVRQVNAHGTPIPAHERALLAGALPADFDLSEVEQERHVPDSHAILVEFNGPQMVHNQPSKSGAPFSQIINAAGDTVLGSDKRRKRAVLCSIDNPFYYATTQRATPNTASAALWPANVPLPLENADEVWCAAAPPLTGVVTPASTSYATTTFAGAAAGSVSLPAGQAITGFDVTFAAAAAPVSGTITVSGLSGANIVYNVDISATGDNEYSVRFPGNGLPALNAGTQITVAVNAIAGGSAGTIVAYGLVPASTAAPGAATTATLAVVVEIYAD